MASPIELKLSKNNEGDVYPSGADITLTHTYNPTPGDGESDVTESIPLFLTGDKASVLSTVGEINRALFDAKSRSDNNYGDRVYLMARSGTADPWYRSPIIEGRLSITDDGIIAGLASSVRTNATLTVTRRGYFEAGTATWLQVTNGNGTASAAGGYLNVYNCNDETGSSPTKLVNHVYAGSAIVSGDLPTPATVYINNQGTALSAIYLSASQSHYQSALPSVYFSDQGGSADATCSGGSATITSISTDAETQIAAGTITGADLYQMGGAPYHVIARFADTTSLGNVKFRLKIKNGAGTATVWSSGQLSLANTGNIIQDLGVVNIPAGSPYDVWNCSIYVTAQRTTASTETIKVDYLAFMGGSFSQIKCISGTTIAKDDIIIFGGANNTLTRWIGGSSTAAVIDVVPYGAGAPILYPGRDNTFVFAAQGTANAPKNNLLKVRVSYRPRRSSL